VVELLRKHFVAFALNNAGWTINMTPAEAVWLKDRGARACTQGMVVFTAGGRMLGTAGGYQAAPNIKMFKEALRKYRPEQNVEVGDSAAPVDPKELPAGWRQVLPRVVPRPAPGGLVLYVTWKAFGLPQRPAVLPKNCRLADYQLHRKMLLVDRVWAGKAEADALAAGEFPEKMKQRVAVHVNYIMNSKIKSLDLRRHKQRVFGSLLLENGERCPALGYVSANNGRVSRFELIIKGMTDGKAGAGSGFPSIGGLVPEGKRASVAVAFLLASPGDELAKVQTGCGKDLGGGAEKGPASGKANR
jgi:hypothetical protein